MKVNILLAFAFCALAQSSYAAPTAFPIKIGFLTDLSGKAAYLGQHARIGAELAAEDINRDGQKLELVFGDHGMDPARAVTEAQKLLNVDKVGALYSTFSGTSRAAAPIARSAGKLFVYAAAAVSPIRDNPVAFKSYLDYESGCQSLASGWKASGVQSVGIMRAESEFGELCERGVIKIFPDALIQAYKLGEEVNTQVLTFKGRKVEGIFNAGLEGDMSNMLKALERIDFHPRVGANEDVFTEKIRTEFPKFVPQIMMFGMPQPDPAFVAQAKSMEKNHEVRSFDSAGMAYLHIRQMYNSLEVCASKGIECEIESLKKSPADGRFGFEGWSDSRQARYKTTTGGIR
jgi:ABC-type branched-subunit amino acid transport system substrate-binding protein